MNTSKQQQQSEYIMTKIIIHTLAPATIAVAAFIQRNPANILLIHLTA
jgi:hypothetical protein